MRDASATSTYFRQLLAVAVYERLYAIHVVDGILELLRLIYLGFARHDVRLAQGGLIHKYTRTAELGFRKDGLEWGWAVRGTVRRSHADLRRRGGSIP